MSSTVWRVFKLKFTILVEEQMILYKYMILNYHMEKNKIMVVHYKRWNSILRVYISNLNVNSSTQCVMRKNQ